MKRCLNCMEIYQDEFDVCPLCGYVENTVSEIPYALPASTVIADRYIIGTVIGAGGFGITYVAWDTKLEIKIAIKEYFPTGLVNRVPETLPINLTGMNNEPAYRKGMQGFIAEAKALAKFNESSGVVNVFDCIEANGTAYIIMEYIRGKSLEDLLKTGRTFSLEEILKITDTVLKVLDYLHSRKPAVFYGDLKPDNLMMTSAGTLYLVDFGSATFEYQQRSHKHLC